MRIIKTIRNEIILVGVLCVAGYVAYQVLLDDEAKRQLRELGKTMNDSYDQLTGLVNDRIGTIMDEDVVEENRTQIRHAWEALGF